jgi:Flp pilus assembly protein TadB
MGLIGTMSALVLGLLIATAQSSFSARSGEFTQMSANIILLDRLLAHYGNEAKNVRDLLRRTAARELQLISPENDLSAREKLDPRSNRGDALFDALQELSPKNDAQRSLQAQALTMAINLGQTRWLLFEQSGTSIPVAFLIVVIFWLSVIFAGFGLFAPRNATVVAAFVVGALSVSGAIFLILELDRPLQGFIHMSDVPLRNALAILGQ